MKVRGISSTRRLAGLFARPGRMILTVLGTVVGLAALVATVGLSSTAGNRIAGRFDEMAATEIIVTVRSVGQRPRRPSDPLGCCRPPRPAQRCRRRRAPPAT